MKVPKEVIFVFNLAKINVKENVIPDVFKCLYSYMLTLTIPINVKLSGRNRYKLDIVYTFFSVSTTLF